jgi:hypothetical protein
METITNTNTKLVNPYGIEGLDDEQLRELIRLGSIMNRVSDIDQLKKDAVAQLKIINDDDILEKISEKTKGLTSSDINKMSPDCINELFIIDGEDVGTIFKEDSNITESQFKKDFLINKIKIEEMLKGLDEEQLKYEKDMEVIKERVKAITAEFEDLTLAIQARLETIYQTDTEISEWNKKKLRALIVSIEDSYTLKRIHTAYKKFGTKNAMYDYLSEDRSMMIYESYKYNIKKYKHIGDIRVYTNLEKRFLPEKYHEYDNLFLFLVIRFIKYKKSWRDKEFTNVFLTNLLSNVKRLFKNELSEDQKSKFLDTICWVLDLFYD